MSSGVTLVAAPRAGAPRVSLRVDSGGTAADVVGHLLGTDDGHLIVLPTDHGPRWVPQRDIRARREVGPRMVRPASNPLDLERVAALGWPGTESFRLGGWVLRAGGGWTGRANSCLVGGDPGLPVAEALTTVADFYRHRGLAGRLQIPMDADGRPLGRTRSPGPTCMEVDAAAEVLGWQGVDDTMVLVAEKPAPATTGSLPEGLRAHWADRPTEAWLGLLRGGEGTDPRVSPVLTAAPARYLTLLRDDLPVAIGRGATAEGWLGISCVEVLPEHRRRGLGRAITELLLADSLAPYCYLQVVDGNIAALRLYEPLGFTLHHRYRYRLAPG